MVEGPGMPVPWPAMLDLITSTLMVFMLVTTLGTVLANGDPEAALMLTRQAKFLEDFQQEFAPEIGRRQVRIERHVDFVQILFSDGVLFRVGDHHLQGSGKRLVARCAHLFARAGSSEYQQIQVEGHTDDVPLDRPTYPSNNWELSTARALSVVEFLSLDEPALAAVLSANGYSSNRPVASNLTQAGRDLNRRIEIRLFFSGPHSSGDSNRRRPDAESPR
jgi:flagellar motor protein MotB